MKTSRQLRRLSTSSSSCSRRTFSLSLPRSEPSPSSSSSQSDASAPALESPPRQTLKKKLKPKLQASFIRDDPAAPPTYNTPLSQPGPSSYASTSSNPYAGLHQGWLIPSSTSTPSSHPTFSPAPAPLPEAPPARRSSKLKKGKRRATLEEQPAVERSMSDVPSLVDIDWTELIAKKERDTIKLALDQVNSSLVKAEVFEVASRPSHAPLSHQPLPPPPHPRHLYKPPISISTNITIPPSKPRSERIPISSSLLIAPRPTSHTSFSTRNTTLPFAEDPSVLRTDLSRPKPTRSNLRPSDPWERASALPRLAPRSPLSTSSTRPPSPELRKDYAQDWLSIKVSPKPPPPLFPSSEKASPPASAFTSIPSPNIVPSSNQGSFPSTSASSPSASSSHQPLTPAAGPALRLSTPLPDLLQSPPPRSSYGSVSPSSRELHSDEVPFFATSDSVLSEPIHTSSLPTAPPLTSSSHHAPSTSGSREPEILTPLFPSASHLQFDHSEDPEAAWKRYHQSNFHDQPSSSLSSLFDSQAGLPNLDIRGPRLLKIFLQISRRPVGSVLSPEQVKAAFLDLLEMGEELSVCPVKISDEGQIADHRAQRLAIAALGRELWRHLTLEMMEANATSSALWISEVAKEERREMLWRWIGLVASGLEREMIPPPSSYAPHLQARSLPRNSRSPLPTRFAGPKLLEDCDHARLIFLDRLGSASPSLVLALAQSCTLVPRPPLAADHKVLKTIESLRKVRHDRDRALMALKRVDLTKWSPWRLAKGEARRAEQGLSLGYLKGKPSVAGFDGERSQEWIRDLLEVKAGSGFADAMESGKLDEASAASLASRTTTSILLLVNVVDNNETVSPHTAHLIITSLLALRTLSAPHHIPHQTARQLLSSLLTADEDLNSISSQDLHELIFVFLQFHDLPFTQRLYELFRMRERKYVFPLDVIQKLLKLSLDFGSASLQTRRSTGVWEDKPERRLLGRSSPFDIGFASTLYADFIAWGGGCLEGSLLARFLLVVGSRSDYIGLASRALADTLAHNGPDAMTPTLAHSIASSVTLRIVSQMSEAHHNFIGYGTPLPSSVLGVANAFDILPLLRGLFPAASDAPIDAFNVILSFVAEHPTAENRTLIEREVRTMLSHGPRPDGGTFEILMKLQLGLSMAREGSYRGKIFQAFETCESRCDVSKATSYFQTMVKLKVPPSPSSYALFVPSLLELSDLPSALQAFHHSNNILSSPPPKRIIMMLLNALLKAGWTMEASKTFEDWERCSSERARTEEGGDVRAVRKEVAWVRYRAFASEQKVDLVERGSEGVNTEAAVLTAGVNGSEALELETVPEVGDEDEDDYVSLRQQGYRAATA